MSCDDMPIIGARARPSTRVAGHRPRHDGRRHERGTGQLMADLIAGRAPAIDPAPYRIGAIRMNEHDSDITTWS